MIILGGKKKAGSIVASIRDKMSGKGMNHDDMKYDHEDHMGKEGDVKQALEHAAHNIMEALKANDVKNMEHSLKAFIELCLKSKYSSVGAVNAVPSLFLEIKWHQYHYYN